MVCRTLLECSSSRIATEFLDPSGISALAACRLVPLDKKPGVRPIGVCETVRRIIAKAILDVVKSDIQSVAGPLQLCAGQDAGCEAAVHSMHAIFDDPNTEAVLLIDASNAFNNLNRQVALENISINCPSIFPALANMYRQPAKMFVGGETLLSSEGTTQGDPLAMPMYALATIPLIKKIATKNTKQVLYADDAAGGGPLESLKQWWDKLNAMGSLFGYYPNSKKSWLIVKPGFLDNAKELFLKTDVNITTDGRKYLGAALGNREFCKKFVKEKIIEWTSQIERLSAIAQSQPQAAHAALTHAVIGRWVYSLRTNEDTTEFLHPLEKLIHNKFIPAITGRPPPGEEERKLLQLPPRLGGLGIANPLFMNQEYTYSKTVSAPLVNLILQQKMELGDTAEQQASLKRDIRKQKKNDLESRAEQITNKLPLHLNRCVELAKEKGASCWLTTLPIKQHGFTLHKSAFRDALCLRYGWQPPRLPDRCPCGASFTIDHSLSCPTGGYPTIRHNEVRDLFSEMLQEVCYDVQREPILQPLTGEILTKKTSTTDDEARLDITANGFWGGRFQRTFYDVRIFNPNSKSYRSTSVTSCYKRQEMGKKRKYEERINTVEHASFTPIILACTGGCSKITTTFIKRLSSLISQKRNLPYSKTVNWVRCRLGFALLRACIMSLRGSRVKYHHHPTSDYNILLANAEGRLT